jgi:hypothetical protein
VPAPNGCLIWTGHTAKGYGRFTYKNRFHLAHREAWIAAKGPIPAGLLVCHTCDTPRCVNVAHMFLGTHKDNADDMIRKGRWRTGVPKNGYSKHSAKITPETVVLIRESPETGVSMARKYGLAEDTVRRIRHRITWKDIP